MFLPLFRSPKRFQEMKPFLFKKNKIEKHFYLICYLIVDWCNWLSPKLEMISHINFIIQSWYPPIHYHQWVFNLPLVIQNFPSLIKIRPWNQMIIISTINNILLLLIVALLFLTFLLFLPKPLQTMNYGNFESLLSSSVKTKPRSINSLSFSNSRSDKLF